MSVASVSALEQATEAQQESVFTQNDIFNKQSESNNPYAAQVKEMANDYPTTSFSDSHRIKRNIKALKISTNVIKANNELQQSGQGSYADSVVNSMRGEVEENNVKSTPQKAQLVNSFEPRYPIAAKRKRLELDVKVNFTIGIDGKITNVQFEPQSRISYFKSAILEAMKKWRFLPAQENGQPVESEMAKIFSFNLAD